MNRIKEKIMRLHCNSFMMDLFVTCVGQAFVMIIAFILNKVISNQYSVDDFAIYSLTRRTASVIIYIVMMAMGIAIPKFIAQAREQQNHADEESYMVSGLMIIAIAFVISASVLYVGRSFVSEILFKDQMGEKYIAPVIAFSLATALCTYAFSFYRGVNDFVQYNMISIWMNLFMLVVSLIFPNDLYRLYSIWSIVLLCYSIWCLYKVFNQNHYSILPLKAKTYTMVPLLQYSLPRVPGEIVLFSYNLIPLAVISNRIGLEAVAFISVAISINSLITPLFSLVGTLLLPLASKSIVNGQVGNLKQKINLLAVIYLCLGFLMVITVFFFGEMIITLLFNEGYVRSFSIVKITIWAIIPNAFYLLYRNPLDGMSKFPYNTTCLLISVIVLVVLLMLANTIEQCAYAFVIAYVVLGVLSFLFWEKVLYKVNKEKQA